MKICLLTEGSYPYVEGGVSSWVQMLMEGLPEHEFLICSIGAEAKDRGKYKYRLPKNCVGIREEFLDDILSRKASGMKEGILSSSEREALHDLVTGDKEIPFVDLVEIFHYGRKERAPLDVFMSSDFFDIIQRVYEENYRYLPFADFFWTLRSMYLPLFYLLQQDLPEADVYHSVATGYCGIIGGMAATVCRKPFLLTEHDICPREREAEIIKSDWAKGDFKAIWIRYFYRLAHLAYGMADHVCTLFEYQAEVERSLGCPPEKIGVVPNGIRMEQFEGIPEVQEHDGPFSIGAVARVVPVKDIVTLIRAFFLVKQKLTDAKLFIMGQCEEDPEYYGICRQTMDMLGLSDVVFTGSVNVAEYLARMDLLVLSSISEGQPLEVLEGQAAHRPFVTTDVGCCRELIYGDSRDNLGAAGAVVAPMDFERMSEEILRLAGDFSLRRRMGKIGYERVKRFYTYERFLEAYREIYEKEGKVSR